MHAHVVIGANYGDEGKGLMTDYLVRQHDAQVVARFNGGAQAGHTVVDGDVRHVFSHFGSGTLAGAATFLSEDFVCNPALFVNEWRALPGKPPRVMVDPMALVTTPFDMLINQAIEDHRSGERHGSCGVGFNETIERSNAGHVIRFRDLYCADELRTRLLNILHNHVRARCLQLGLPKESIFRCLDESMIEPFMRDCLRMRQHCEMTNPHELKGRRVVFEGAQGLLLDQNNTDDFPHLTRSNTGCRNAVKLASQVGISELALVYVSRTYLTRHGAGPLPFEWHGDEVPGSIVDETNKPHPYQGTLRFAPLNWGALCMRIMVDAEQARNMLTGLSVAMTCLDQVGPPNAWHNFESFGPTAADVAVTDRRKQIA